MLAESVLSEKVCREIAGQLWFRAKDKNGNRK